MPLFILNEIILKFNYEKFQFVCAEIEIKFHYSWMEFFTLPIETKNFPKKFCVGCKCYTNLKFSNRHNSPPNAARESKIPPCDSESRTLSTCILRFVSKKIDLPTFFSFYQYMVAQKSKTDTFTHRYISKPFKCYEFYTEFHYKNML